ncbi:MAG: sigma 54-interacting transcriptional regulator, partial [Butyricicoccus sp.]
INLQSKLLRVLQDGMIRRVGGMNEIHVDVRVLSNINIPPYQAIAENKLRRDLFYRLGVVNINVPPLRERREDIPLLAKHFIMRCNRKLVRNVRSIDRDTLERFRTYSWPGNVRELQHAIEHAMNILPNDASVITSEYIPEHILVEETAAQQTPKQDSLSGAIHNLEYSAICKVLRENGGNISESARVLGMSRQNLQYRIKRYKIDMQALLLGGAPQ